MAIRLIIVEEEIDTQEALVGDTELLAGQIAPAGVYQDIETGRVIVLSKSERLPASCNGRVAIYTSKTPTWGEKVWDRLVHEEKGRQAPGLTRPKLHFVNMEVPQEEEGPDDQQSKTSFAA